MTNPITTLSRERLEDMSSGNWPDFGFYDDVKTMARALLAVMDAKPIGYFRDDARAVFRVWPTKSDDCNVPVYTTPPAPSAPDGWKLVPVEPTAKMMVAGTLVSEFQEDPAGMYRAMIAAAPGGE